MNFQFDGSISREVLNNYLSRAVTHCGIGMDNNLRSATVADDLRMLKREGAKFIGRATYTWGETDEAQHFKMAAQRAGMAHAVDPDFILQACVFECIKKSFVDTVPVPAWVFADFGLTVENRCFRYNDMLFPDGTYVNHWGRGSSVEDITRLESRLWIYYRSCAYIAAGYEGIHFGQVHLIGATDDGFFYWKQLVGMIRAFAVKHARRHYVLCDAHTHGIVLDGEMLFDYNAWPLRLKEIIDKPYECELAVGYHDGIYGDRRSGRLGSRGGRHPSGWEADSMPFIVEFDNFGRSNFEYEARHDSYYVWGFDEITWFAMQPREYRHQFLRYVWDWSTGATPRDGYRCRPAAVSRGRSRRSGKTPTPPGWITSRRTRG